jgi:hypothetical protein
MLPGIPIFCDSNTQPSCTVTSFYRLVAVSSFGLAVSEFCCPLFTYYPISVVGKYLSIHLVQIAVE